MGVLNPAAFREFEHQGWQQVAPRYNDSFGPLTTQAVDSLLDAARVFKGARVLDVACGPGYVAEAVAARGADVVGLDFSSEMIKEARRRCPTIEFLEGDAEQLPLPNATFDAVVSNFGLLHLARPERALAEAHRVLRQAGRVAFTVWNTPDQAMGFGIVLAAIQKYGDPNVAIPEGPPFFRFSDPEESRHVLTATGFSAPSVIEVRQEWHLPSPETLFDVMYNSSVRTAALLRAQKPEALKLIQNQIRQEVDKQANKLSMPAVLAIARKD